MGHGLFFVDVAQDEESEAVLQQLDMVIIPKV